jgi:hypothetical protein
VFIANSSKESAVTVGIFTSRAKTKAPTGECEIHEWLTIYATADFKKGGEHAFHVAKKDNLSPFRQTHVRVFSLLVRRADVSPLTFMFTIVSVSRSEVGIFRAQ